MRINLYNEDCLIGMKRIPDASVDCVLTDPPYLYLKNQKLDRSFDEQAFFAEVKRILKKRWIHRNVRTRNLLLSLEYDFGRPWIQFQRGNHLG